MPEVIDLYGSSLDLESARRATETALGVAFEPHESSYRGGDYYRCMDSFILQRNEELDGEAMEPDFPGVPTLLFVSAVADPDAVREQLTSAGHFELLYDYGTGGVELCEQLDGQLVWRPWCSPRSSP